VRDHGRVAFDLIDAQRRHIFLQSP
jgi:hypothetical protein